MSPVQPSPHQLLSALAQASTGLLVLRQGQVAFASEELTAWLGDAAAPGSSAAGASQTLREAASACELEGPGASKVVMVQPGDARRRPLEILLRTELVDGATLVVGSLRRPGGAPTASDALLDRLTGLPSRAHLFEQVAALVLAGHDRPFAVLMVDLDGFKAVNDGHGHGAGDRVLAVVAQRLAGLVRDDDLVARLGGDEFALLLAEVRSEAEAAAMAQRIFATVQRPMLIGDRRFSLGCSVGASLFPLHGLRPDELMARADAAMYDAKRAGRSTFRLFHENAASPAVIAPSSVTRRSQVVHLGDDELDAAHDQLLECANAVVTLARQGPQRATELAAALAQLEERCRRHFAEEEQLMAEARLPGLEAHRRAHQGLLSRLARCRAARAGDWPAVLQVADAMVDHMQTVDVDHPVKPPAAG